jgi:hypothetical protein
MKRWQKKLTDKIAKKDFHDVAAQASELALFLEDQFTNKIKFNHEAI